MPPEWETRDVALAPPPESSASDGACASWPLMGAEWPGESAGPAAVSAGAYPVPVSNSPPVATVKARLRLAMSYMEDLLWISSGRRVGGPPSRRNGAYRPGSRTCPLHG